MSDPTNRDDEASSARGSGSRPGTAGRRRPVSPHHTLDLDAIERDLADVDAALTRLDNDTYWVDEVTGQPLSADLLASQPTARRNNP